MSIPRQRALLRAAVFGRAFASDVPAALLHQLAIKMRILNALREPEVGVPLTLPQLEALSLPVVISRWAALPWGRAASVVDVAAVTCSMTAVLHLMSLSVAWRQAVVFSGGLAVRAAGCQGSTVCCLVSLLHVLGASASAATTTNNAAGNCWPVALCCESALQVLIMLAPHIRQLAAILQSQCCSLWRGDQNTNARNVGLDGHGNIFSTCLSGPGCLSCG